MASPTQRANRRKLLVFLGTFLLACAVSLGYTFSRPAEYRASARVQINPGAVQVESIKPLGGSQGADAPRPFLTELQVITSRPVVEAAAERLRVSLRGEVPGLGPDPVAAMQSMLQINAAQGADVVELSSTGGDAELVAALVNTVIGTYTERLEQAYRATSTESLEQINDEVAKLAAKVAEKRRVVEDFRIRHNVVSLEREENQLLSRVRGQSTALNNANEKLAMAEGKLRALSEAAAAGRPVVRSRDNPTLANLEQRASRIREELRDLERSYTPDYLALDQKVQAQRIRLEELDRQIVLQRSASQETALAESQDEVASAREVVNRIQAQIANDRGAVQVFTARFNDYKGMREDLGQLESLYRDTMQRKVKLEAGERARRPSVRILEAAAVPQEAWRPLYGRDAAISIGVSLISALLVMWLVELFNRADPQPTMLVAQPVAYPVPRGPAVVLQSAPPALEGIAAPALLFAAPELPRELGPDEVRGVLEAASPEVRAVMALLLGGVAPEELLSLQCDDIDIAARQIRVRGDSARTIDLVEPTASLLDRLPRTAGAPLYSRPDGNPRSLDELASDLLYAAHDAGIDRPVDVTPAALRHSYVAFLAKQGIRLADLAKLVGRLSPDQAAIYSSYAPPGKRVTLEQVDPVMPGIRGANLG